ncbi:hypothetical protein RHMOL_Rhmol02G0123100 [Rhododendron molle]|uniref:Uncharacterized protein n=1 Tax=Rhododendron molle TaxID=49168 RepID=A0ACC0PP00_RHOML|nr:hypothetical protein RHMOL_Rhmol02G0123100 [Rhododendron molle]
MIFVVGRASPTIVAIIDWNFPLTRFVITVIILHIRYLSKGADNTKIHIFPAKT